MNDFKKCLQVRPVLLLTNRTQENQAIEELKRSEFKKHSQLYSKKDIQEYFHYVIAAIMLSQNEYYEFHGINIPYRFKSPKSISDKLAKHIEEGKIYYNDKQEIVIEYKPILDALAMKVISRRRPPAFSSTDPEIKKLLEEKKKNQLFLEKIQNFKARLIEDEYTKSESYKYKYECTKIEYYETCKKILIELKKIVNPVATNLIANYNNKILDIDNRLYFLYAMHTSGTPDQLVDYSDLTESNINFFKILSEYENSVYNKSDLAILTKQFISIFNQNEIFEKLGVSISKIPMKEKRTENGFESNFIYIDTLFGTIECQLQTEDQYRSGNYGHAAHTKMKGKSVKPLSIPDIRDKEQINQFIKELDKISPKCFLARMDDNEHGRVMIQQYNDYQNYKSLISQIPKGDPREKFLHSYFSKLYALRKKIFKSQGRSLGFIDYDINEYIESDTLKKLKSMALMKNNNINERD